MDLVQGVIDGRVLAVARMISMVERQAPEAVRAMQQIYGRCGGAHIVGITGPPGAGKSCLVAALIKQLREKDLSVGVLAVDPSSPFTGGAILGDRARMMELASDPQVFIRSLATRGSVGGLAEAVNGAVDIFDAAGKDIILIETVGVGQNEIDIVKLAHTVVLVLVPGYGDGLQAMKAGIMEVGDILVVNKADLPGAENVVSELCAIPENVAAETVLNLPDTCRSNWQVPVTRTTAVKGEGSADLVALIARHHRFLESGKRLAEKNRERRVNQFMEVLTRRIRTEFYRQYQIDQDLQRWVEKIENLKMDPYQAAQQVIDFMVAAGEEKRKRLIKKLNP